MWVLFKFDLSEFMAFAGTNPFTHNVTVHLKCLFKQQTYLRLLTDTRKDFPKTSMSSRCAFFEYLLSRKPRLNETSTCE